MKSFFAWAMGCCLLVLVSLSVRPAMAFIEKEGDNFAFEATGSGRLTGVYLHYPETLSALNLPDDGLFFSVLRVLIAGELGDVFNYDLNVYNTLSRMPSQTQVQGAFSAAGKTRSPYISPYLDWQYWDNETVSGKAGVFHLKVNIDLEPLAVSIGRQPVNYTIGTVFSPNDFFAPFASTAINTVYKPGVDALRFTWSTGNLSNIELVGVLGNNTQDRPSGDQSALLIKANTLLWDTDLTLLGGKLAERYIVGAGFQKSVGITTIRAEGHFGGAAQKSVTDSAGNTFARHPFHANLTTEVGWIFPWQNLSVTGAYLYLSDGAEKPHGYLQRTLIFYPDEMGFLSRHYGGLTLGMELHPLLQLGSMAIVNFSDGSFITTTSLIYSISDEAEAVLGIMAPYGKRPQLQRDNLEMKSEFGAAPTTVYLETRFYF